MNGDARNRTAAREFTFKGFPAAQHLGKVLYLREKQGCFEAYAYLFSEIVNGQKKYDPFLNSFPELMLGVESSLNAQEQHFLVH